MTEDESHSRVGDVPEPQRRGPAPTGPRRRRWARPVVAAGAALALTLTTASIITSAPPAAAALTRFETCDAVDQWFTEPLLAHVGPYGLNDPSVSGIGLRGGPALASPQSAPDATVMAQTEGPTTDSVADAVANGSTGTNVQEAGVDEPDVIKARDGLVLTISGADLVTLDTSAGQARVLGRLELPERRASPGDAQPAVALGLPSSLVWSGDRVLVLTTRYAWPVTGWGPVGGPAVDAAVSTSMVGQESTVMTVVDVSTPAAPRIVTSSEIEGGLVDARLIDPGTPDQASVRVVTSTTPLPQFVLPGPLPSSIQPRIPGAVDSVAPSAGTGAPAPESPDEVSDGGEPPSAWDESSAAAENKRRLRDLGGRDFLPHLLSRDADGVVRSRTPAIECADLAHPGEYTGPSVLTVSTLRLDQVNPGSEPVASRTALTAEGNLVYSSRDRLYVATSRWWSSFDASSPAADGSVDSTSIHAFDLTSASTTSYLASGQVPGTVIGRWAFSERAGVLRVATTRTLAPDGTDGTDSMDGGAGGGDSLVPAVSPTESSVLTLGEEADQLVVLGRVDGLGPGERIQSVRWFDDTAYVVTFRQTDPLYVVDLRDPAAPTVTGELKVPGFSAYLHPIGSHRLLGVGSAGDESGLTTGMQVSVFDVKDPRAPRLVDSAEDPQAFASAGRDARAFSYLPDQATAVLPVDTLGGQPSPGSASAVFAYRVAEDGTLAAPAVLDTGGCVAERAIPVDSSGSRLAVLCQALSWPPPSGDDTWLNQLIVTDSALIEASRVAF
ncbi:MAG: beta-propeller domain-containing protein [Actinomycetales bacterium]